jgi:hypothetical protein
MVLSKDVFRFPRGMRERVVSPVLRATWPAYLPEPQELGEVLEALVLRASVLGGIGASLLLSVAGWIALLMPTGSELNFAAQGLLVTASICLGLAIIAAHVYQDRYPMRDKSE